MISRSRGKRRIAARNDFLVNFHSPLLNYRILLIHTHMKKLRTLPYVILVRYFHV